MFLEDPKNVSPKNDMWNKKLSYMYSKTVP